jgi:hypothetical protein
VPIVSGISKINPGILPVASNALQALRHRVTVEWPKIADDEARKLLVRTAREGHERIMHEQTARAGFAPQWEAYANTPANTNLETVKLPGPIVYRYRYINEIVFEAVKALQDASPVDSGEYKNSHFVWVNREKVNLERAADLNRGDELFIANTVPYSRRLEVGKTDSGRDFVIQVEPHIYERVAEMLKAKYQNTNERGVAAITFNYVTLPNAWVIKGRLGPKYRLPTGKFRKRRQQIGDRVRAPAIFIEPLS